MKTNLQKGVILKNRYEILSVIGRGGFGITYQAVDRLLNCYVAVKEFSPEEKEKQGVIEVCRTNFRYEARVLEAVKDVPYIARLRDHFEENGTEYIVLNLIQGKSLSQYIRKRSGKLSASEVLSLLQNIFDTLTELHSRGIIHRDISPGNLIFSVDHILYLIDFGSATSFDGNTELQNEQIFKHKGLAAPEYAETDKQGPWTDVFSLCATIVYLITGEGLVEAKDRQKYDHLPQLLMRTSLSSRQQNALIKGLSPDISRRFENVEQLHEELYGEALIEEVILKEWPVFYHARTYTGSRPINQDNFTVDTVFYYKGEDCEKAGILNCGPEEIHVAAVCDGIGGSNHGELAAKAVIQAIIHFVEAFPESEARPDRLLEEMLDQINEKILQFGKKIGQTATTLALLLWRGNRYYAVNIGDSPIFCMRRGKLERLSTAHTVAELNMKMEKPVQRSDWNTLTQYMGKKGVAGSQMAAFRYGKLQKGDTFLVCTDGVSKKMEEDRLKRYLIKKGTKALSSIFKAIEKKEHNDNCTAIVLKF